MEVSTSNKNGQDNFWGKFTNKFFNSHNYSTRRKFYNSLWSILLGLVITSVIISFFGYNPFKVITSFFGDANVSNVFIPTLTTFILSGLAIAICFRAGIFNIGVPGQMMTAGFITLVMIRSAVAKLQPGEVVSHSVVFVSILLSIILSIVVSLVIGALKTYLHVNEVVSSIMLNWVIFFIIRYIVGMNQQGTSGFYLTTGELYGYGKTSGYTPYVETPSFYYIESWYSSAWSWILIILTLAITVSIWIVIKYTKFGYKVKMVGLSSTAADYSGTNKRNLILITMAISGLLSGLAGFIWYFSVEQGVIDISITSGPLYVGFNAIAISLIVFDNPIAIIFSSLIFSIISVGSQTATSFPALPNEMTDIISGIFIYSAALAFIFTKFLPYQWTRNFFILVKYKKYRNVYWRNWKETFNYHLSWFTEKRDLWNLWKTNHDVWNNIKKKMKEKENEEIKKLIHPETEFSFEKLDNQKQIEYLELLARLKKEKEILLSEEHYFDNYRIKARRKEIYLAWKHEFNDLKKEIINQHLNIIDESLEETTKELALKQKELDEQEARGGQQ